MTRTAAAAWLCVVLVGFSLWLFLSRPSADQIASFRQPTTPLPSLNFQILDAQELRLRTIKGSLPLKPESVGRTDPFAGVSQ